MIVNPIMNIIWITQLGATVPEPGNAPKPTLDPVPVLSIWWLKEENQDPKARGIHTKILCVTYSDLSSPRDKNSCAWTPPYTFTYNTMNFGKVHVKWWEQTWLSAVSIILWRALMRGAIGHVGCLNPCTLCPRCSCHFPFTSIHHCLNRLCAASLRSILCYTQLFVVQRMWERVPGIQNP